MPNAAFFVCQQHAPQHFWKPEYQRHANGARSISRVVMVANRPRGLADFFSRLTEPSAVSSVGEELHVTMLGGQLIVVTPGRFYAEYPTSKGITAPEGPHFAAYRITVNDLAALEARLRRQGIAHRNLDGRLAISPQDAFGVAIEFGTEHE